MAASNIYKPWEGAGGGSTFDPTDQVLKDSVALAPTGNETLSFLKKLTKHQTGITTWTTLATITPSSVVSNYARGFVEARIVGLTNNVGSGSRFSRWYFDYAGAVPTVAVIGADVSSGTGVPQFRLLASGNNVLLQVQSSNGTDSANMGFFADVYTPRSSGAITWTVA